VVKSGTAPGRTLAGVFLQVGKQNLTDSF